MREEQAMQKKERERMLDLCKEREGILQEKLKGIVCCYLLLFLLFVSSCSSFSNKLSKEVGVPSFFKFTPDYGSIIVTNKEFMQVFSGVSLSQYINYHIKSYVRGSFVCL